MNAERQGHSLSNETTLLQMRLVKSYDSEVSSITNQYQVILVEVKIHDRKCTVHTPWNFPDLV